MRLSQADGNASGKYDIGASVACRSLDGFMELGASGLCHSFSF
jgi:hypothetical protein